MNATLIAITGLAIFGCVQTNTTGSYTSISTLSHGTQTITRTQSDQWQNQRNQSPAWQAQITPAGSRINIQANPAPPPVNIIVVPAQAPCYNGPHLTRGIILPGQSPCP